MSKKTDALSFEEAFSKLGEILQALESGEQPLAESLALYEQGMALAKYCNVQLDTAELKIKSLAENSD